MRLRILVVVLAAVLFSSPSVAEIAYLVGGEGNITLLEIGSSSAQQVAPIRPIQGADSSFVPLVGLARKPDGQLMALLGFSTSGQQLVVFDEESLTTGDVVTSVGDGRHDRLVFATNETAYSFRLESTTTGRRQFLASIDAVSGATTDLMEITDLCMSEIRGLTYTPDLGGGRIALLCRESSGPDEEVRMVLIDPVSLAVTQHVIDGIEQFVIFFDNIAYLPDTRRIVTRAILGLDHFLISFDASTTDFTPTVLGPFFRETYYGAAFFFGQDALIPAERPCLPSATEMCLNGDEITGRFKVSATWERPDGSTGQAFADQRTEDSGQFWFFRDTNLELDIKVLDNCDGPTNRFWVFASGLTNLGAVITVEDTMTGAVKTYTNAVGTPFPPILDTQAFDTCP